MNHLFYAKPTDETLKQGRNRDLGKLDSTLTPLTLSTLTPHPHTLTLKFVIGIEFFSDHTK